MRTEGEGAKGHPGQAGHRGQLERRRRKHTGAEESLRVEVGSFELGFCPRQRHDFVVKETPKHPQ